jgi:AraC family transcriptional regulator of adaptative response / DNA-3-methyladenine glycosylase II
MKIKRGLRVPGAFDGFELAVRAILGQQISVKAARTLACRLTEKFGKTVTTPFAAIHKIFPPPHVIAGLPVGDLTALGLTTARANTVLALAGAVTGKSLDLSVTADVAQTVAALQKIPGIGEWTAEYIAMRALAWPDAFLATDLGVKKALGETSHKKIRELAAQWQPWRAYATMQLWHQ